MIKILLINSIVIFAGAYLLNGVTVKNFLSAIGVAVVLAIINALLKPLILFLTLPLTILTLGLFVLVINAWMLMLADKVIDGFKIKNFWWAVIFSIFISIANGLMLRIF
ncbi:MAG: phage holin family protein [Balneolaceae bacterium]|nr:MAG: phage holin family protein [Balneolaceae bacterium]